MEQNQQIVLQKMCSQIPQYRPLRISFLAHLFFLMVSATSAQPVPSSEQFGIQLVNEKIYFKASSVKALFRDGTQHEYGSNSIQYNSTVIGDYISFRDKVLK